MRCITKCTNRAPLSSGLQSAYNLVFEELSFNTHTQTGRCEHSAIKYEILSFAITWMSLVGIMLSEISQTEKDNYCMISHIRGIKKINKQDKVKIGS